MSREVRPESWKDGLDEETIKAIEEINAILQEVAVRGNNDYEYSAFRKLIKRVIKGEFEGQLQEAVNIAIGMRDNKMDYK